MKKILYIGDLNFGATSLGRYENLIQMGLKVDGINQHSKKNKFINFLNRINRRFGYKYDFEGINKKILDKVFKGNFDLLWIDKGLKITATTLKKVKGFNKDIIILQVNPDDPFGAFRTGWHNFISSIPYYDYHFVPRACNIPEYYSKGANKVILYQFSYNSKLHKPIDLTQEDKNKYGSTIGFIGFYAIEREEILYRLIKDKFPISIWGSGWENKKYWATIKNNFRGNGLYGTEYVKVINGMKIALNFLRKENRDDHTTRSLEIPACGTFMLTERTNKHISLFNEGTEADYFSDYNELSEKLHFYLNNNSIREKVAAAGYLKCISSNYSDKDMIIHILKSVGYDILN